MRPAGGFLPFAFDVYVEEPGHGFPDFLIVRLMP
jgi:hypothetical protein